MLNNSKLADLIWWSGCPEGHTFSLKPSKDFALALNGYFKHGNIASFVRQLHMYGFHKVSDPHTSSQAASDRAPPVWEFRHSSGKFKKNDESSLAYIKRRSQLIPSRNPVVDNSLGSVNTTHMGMPLTGPNSMSIPAVPYPKHYQPNSVPPLAIHQAFVPYPNVKEIKGPLYPPPVATAPPYNEPQSYYVPHNASFTALNSTFDTPFPRDSIALHSGRSRANGGVYINNVNPVRQQPSLHNRHNTTQPHSRPSLQSRNEAPQHGHFQEGGFLPTLPGTHYHTPAFSHITANKVLPGSESHNLSQVSLPGRQTYEPHTEAAQRPTPDATLRLATPMPFSSSEGDPHFFQQPIEPPVSPFALKPLGVSALSSSNVICNDTSATNASRNDLLTSAPREPPTSPQNFTFRRPFSIQTMERQRNPSLLFDPLTVVGKSSPKPPATSKGSNFDVKLPPLSSWLSPIIKDQTLRDDYIKHLVAAESGGSDKFTAARLAHVFDNDMHSHQPRSNSQAALNSLAGKDRSVTAVHCNSLRDRIRPSLVNLHNASQNSMNYAGIQHAKTVDSVASHSSSLFSNGSSISSVSTNRLSFDSVSYGRKSSYAMSPRDEAPPSPGLRAMEPGPHSPITRLLERVGTISEEGLDASTIDSRQSGVTHELRLKSAPLQEPKLEYLLHSGADENRKKQKL